MLQDGKDHDGKLQTPLKVTEHSLGEWGEAGPCLPGFCTLENSEMLHEAAFSEL